MHFYAHSKRIDAAFREELMPHELKRLADIEDEMSRLTEIMRKLALERRRLNNRGTSRRLYYKKARSGRIA